MSQHPSNTPPPSSSASSSSSWSSSSQFQDHHPLPFHPHPQRSHHRNPSHHLHRPVPANSIAPAPFSHHPPGHHYFIPPTVPSTKTKTTPTTTATTTGTPKSLSATNPSSMNSQADPIRPSSHPTPPNGFRDPRFPEPPTRVSSIPDPASRSIPGPPITQAPSSSPSPSLTISPKPPPLSSPSSSPSPSPSITHTHTPVVQPSFTKSLSFAPTTERLFSGPSITNNNTHTPSTTQPSQLPFSSSPSLSSSPHYTPPHHYHHSQQQQQQQQQQHQHQHQHRYDYPHYQFHPQRPHSYSPAIHPHKPAPSNYSHPTSSPLSTPSFTGLQDNRNNNNLSFEQNSQQRYPYHSIPRDRYHTNFSPSYTHSAYQSNTPASSPSPSPSPSSSSPSPSSSSILPSLSSPPVTLSSNLPYAYFQQYYSSGSSTPPHPSHRVSHSHPSNNGPYQPYPTRVNPAAPTMFPPSRSFPLVSSSSSSSTSNHSLSSSSYYQPKFESQEYHRSSATDQHYVSEKYVENETSTQRSQHASLPEHDEERTTAASLLVSMKKIDTPSSVHDDNYDAQSDKDEQGNENDNDNENEAEVEDEDDENVERETADVVGPDEAAVAVELVEANIQELGPRSSRLMAQHTWSQSRSRDVWTSGTQILERLNIIRRPQRYRRIHILPPYRSLEHVRHHLRKLTTPTATVHLPHAVSRITSDRRNKSVSGSSTRRRHHSRHRFHPIELGQGEDAKRRRERRGRGRDHSGDGALELGRTRAEYLAALDEMESEGVLESKEKEQVVASLTRNRDGRRMVDAICAIEIFRRGNGSLARMFLVQSRVLRPMTS